MLEHLSELGRLDPSFAGVEIDPPDARTIGGAVEPIEAEALPAPHRHALRVFAADAQAGSLLCSGTVVETYLAPNESGEDERLDRDSVLVCGEFEPSQYGTWKLYAYLAPWHFCGTFVEIRRYPPLFG